MMKGDGQRLTEILKERKEVGLQKQLISKHDICPRLNFNSSYLEMGWKHSEMEVVMTRGKYGFIKIKS